MAPPQTRRFIEKREAILDAAARLFNRDGVKGATLAGVAQSVGLITNSITYYYRRKEDLACACFLRAIRVIGDLARRSADLPTLSERLTDFFTRWYALQRDIALRRHPELVSFNDIRALPAAHAEVVYAAYNDLFRAVRTLIGSPAHRGLTRTQLNARTHLLLSCAMWVRILVQRYEPDDYELVARRVSDILIHGLARVGQPWHEPAALADLAGIDPDLPAATHEPAAGDFLRAAIELINEQGYRGASVERISARVNVTKGSFYHHHVTKDDLVSACFEHSFETIRTATARACALPGSGYERLSRLGCGLVRHQLSDRGPLLRVTGLSALPPELRHDTLHTLNCLTEKFGAIVVDGMVDGSIRPLDPAVAAQMFSAMINAAAELPRWVEGIGPDGATAMFARPLLLGIGCPAAPHAGVACAD